MFPKSTGLRVYLYSEGTPIVPVHSSPTINLTTELTE